MIDDLRKFLQSRGGFVVAGVVGFIGIVAIIYAVRANFGATDGEQLAADRMFIDADTGKPFAHTLSLNDPIPVKAPSGKNTGYPAEACYWTKDGKPKPEPTWVLMNTWKGSKEPTFCPDCGRLVVGHNPPAVAGKAPPPTKEEYHKRGGASGAPQR